MQTRLLIAPIVLALALAGCGGAATDENGVATGEPIAKIAAPAGQQWQSVVKKTEAGGMVMGNPEAPIKLVEYMSLTCGHCRDFGNEAYGELKDEFVASGRVSFEIRNFVRDPIDLSAALLTRCGGEAPYFALTEAALNDQDTILPLAQQMSQSGQFEALVKLPAEQRFVMLAQSLGMIDLFKQRGLSEDQAKACLADVAAADALGKATIDAQSQDQIQGTPTFLINGQKVDGSNWTMVKNALSAAGAR